MRPRRSGSGARLDRRRFLIASALIGGDLLVGRAEALAQLANASTAGQTGPFGPYVRIAPDGVVTVINKFQDMGQGNHVGVCALVCEELDADWAALRWVHAPASKAYANRLLGSQGTGGSSSIASSFDEMRKAGAAARAMFVEAGARRWGVAPGQISVKDGIVSHLGTHRSATFGELLTDAAKIPPPQDPPLKDPRTFTLVGTARPRRKDTPLKTTGQARYTQDVKAPGLLVAMVAHSPRFGGKVKSFDAGASRKVPGVVEVVQIPTGVAVLADTTWAAKTGRDALRVEWDDSEAETRGSAQILADFKAIAAGNGVVKGVPFETRGDAAHAFEGELFTATYDFPYLAHAAMEPMNCTAQLIDGRVKLTYGCQGHGWDQAAVGHALGIAPESVEIETLFAGGSFGRRASPSGDYVVECVETARALGAAQPSLKGRPVKLVWTREDDMAGGKYRPMVHHAVTIKTDQDGYPVAWRHRIVGQPIFSGPEFKFDPLSVEGVAGNPYLAKIPVIDALVFAPTSPVTVSSWRSVGATHTAMVMEHTIDQLAARAGKDPVAYRRELLSRAGANRHLAVLDLAIAKSDWGAPTRAGVTRAIAVFECFGTVVAQVADITIKDGHPKMERVVCAVDCGVAVSPDQIAAQMEGGVCYGLSAALYGEITLEGGAPVQRNFDTYRVLRIDEAPHVDTYILPSTNAPSGVGEPGVPLAAPLIASALLKLTGKPTSTLPFLKS